MRRCCHGLVFGGSRHCAARVALHLVTLPSFGSTTHTYYSTLHVGHHQSLGLPRALNKGEVNAHGFNVDGDLFSVNTYALLNYRHRPVGSRGRLEFLGHALNPWERRYPIAAKLLVTSKAASGRWYFAPL